MDTIQGLEAALMKDWAMKAMEALGEEKRKELITLAIYKQLNKMQFEWETRKVMEKHAHEYAAQLISEEAVQQKIKEKVREAVNKLIDKFADELAKEFARAFKRAAENL